MAVSYETIRQEVERLRDYITHDLDIIIDQNVGGNYLAASLITCACDALSYLKYKERNKGEKFFTELLPAFWKPVAKSLYGAIRNGIVHTYEIKTIIIDSRRLNIGISWRAKPHLSLSITGEHLYVNIRQLTQDLKAQIAQFEADLKVNAKLRENFHKIMQREREVYIKNPNELKEWQNILSQAPQETP